MRPLVPQSCSRWCGAICVETVKSSRRPSPKSTSALVRRSVPKRRIAIDERDAARGLGLEEEAAGDDRVAADVVEAAAADVRLVADVGGIEVVVAEEHLHRAQRADAALAHELAGAQPLRMEAHHERLGDQRLADRRAKRRRLVGGQRDRLFAQHVLARGGGRERERHVQVIGQRVVDRLDLRIGEQRLVRAVGLGNAERIGGGFAPGLRRARRWPAISRRSLFFIPGNTRSRPIFAVLSTPQTTFFTLLSSSAGAAGVNQLSFSRRRTTLPTMMSVGAWSFALGDARRQRAERSGDHALRRRRPLLHDGRSRFARKAVRDELAADHRQARGAPCRRRSSAAGARARASRDPRFRPSGCP